METLRNRINVKVVNNEKDDLKCISKSSDMAHKIFDNNLVVIRKTKPALKLNKPGYTEMSILELSNVLMYEFHCVKSLQIRTRINSVFGQFSLSVAL